MNATTELVAAADRLAHACDALRFGGAAAFVYNPLSYARRGYVAYVERYGAAPKPVVLVGMNPGPFGMVQTGVPFGHVGLVRDWLGIDVAVDKPAREHPKRPVQGFSCTRSEVSGARLWGWARDRFGTPERFFRSFFVLNYCPLAFVEASGRNLTPDKLPVAERTALFEACDDALARCVAALEPKWLLGIGGFAAARVAPLAARLGLRTGTIPHPSPASPAANRGWSEAAERALADCGIALDPAITAPRTEPASSEPSTSPMTAPPTSGTKASPTSATKEPLRSETKEPPK
jgi:single-strand selective monofunctional uracil DNA glycosylase